ncbi:MAG: D-aminoacyl-tRNA deacylase [Flavobacteriaceae bacterium]
MRVVIQRVGEASVTVDQTIVGQINQGLMVLLGVEAADTQEDIDWLANKILNLRIFNDTSGVMNSSLVEIDGQLLVISQFTLMASTKKGNRPSYIKAANHTHAIPIYEAFCLKLEEGLGKKIERGVFGADMQVALVNDGPVTIQIDSKNRS